VVPGAPVALNKVQLAPSGRLFELRTEDDADARQTPTDFGAARDSTCPNLLKAARLTNTA
jgi:hypothetical protein